MGTCTFSTSGTSSKRESRGPTVCRAPLGSPRMSLRRVRMRTSGRRPIPTATCPFRAATTPPRWWAGGTWWYTGGGTGTSYTTCMCWTCGAWSGSTRKQSSRLPRSLGGRYLGARDTLRASSQGRSSSCSGGRTARGSWTTSCSSISAAWSGRGPRRWAAGHLAGPGTRQHTTGAGASIFSGGGMGSACGKTSTCSVCRGTPARIGSGRS
mmetsp:Transcript_62076/g.196287  ORF Transcript_62076/g.196287 Transcript_62076/m.196287 type:complete len:210 (+) Transcript_62076:793-1422(+)